MDPTITTVRIANISSDTTKQDIMQLFELCTIAYLQENVRVTYFNRRGKHKAYALVRAPKFVCDRMCETNGMEFNSRLLFIEILSSNRSITPYDRRGALRGSSKQSHFPTSGNKTATGYSRCAPNACSRQEDSLSSTSRVVDEPEQINPEEAGWGGRGSSNTQGNRSRAQVASDEHKTAFGREEKPAAH